MTSNCDISDRWVCKKFRRSTWITDVHWNPKFVTKIHTVSYITAETFFFYDKKILNVWAVALTATPSMFSASKHTNCNLCLTKSSNFDEIAYNWKIPVVRKWND